VFVPQVWRLRQTGDVFVTCYSDKLTTLDDRLTSYATNHSGQFPDATNVPVIFNASDDTNLLTCYRSQRPFLWRPDLASVQSQTTNKQLLAWCPPGSHGSYVGALFACSGRVQAAYIPMRELRTLTNWMK